jgi:TRAP transporter TAXI family solute receptor
MTLSIFKKAKPQGSLRDLRLPVLAVLLTLAGFVVAYQFVEPAPPNRITIATGRESGAYYAFAQRYRELLAREDITLDVRTTSGSVENLRLLDATENGADIGLVQSGTGSPESSPDLIGLGSLFFEPLWIFLRKGLIIGQLTELRGKRLAVGEEGSGTRAVVLQLLDANEIKSSSSKFLSLAGLQAANALERGEIDAAFFVASPRSLIVQKLLLNQDVSLMSVKRAEAYRRRYHFLKSVILPEGAIDFSQNIPTSDVILLTPTANLVARKDFHPALTSLILQIATKIHREGGIFEEVGEFPSPKYQDFPLGEVAQRYYQDGPPFLQRFLPFWAATLVDRLKVMLLPLVTLLIPFFKVIPPTYNWRVRSKFYRPYKALLGISVEIQKDHSEQNVQQCLEELQRIEDEIRGFSVPKGYLHLLFSLRHHVDLVRGQIRRAQENRPS